jgi:hypothetical protein
LGEDVADAEEAEASPDGEGGEKGAQGGLKKNGSEDKRGEGGNHGFSFRDEGTDDGVTDLVEAERGWAGEAAC